MDYEIALVAERIRGLREVLDISAEEMAAVCGIDEREYLDYEAGKKDFYFTFLYKIATRCGIDMTELVTGDVPRLSVYSLVRQGNGMPINRKKEFDYVNLAYLFKNKYAEPFLVTVKYDEDAQIAPLVTSTHSGQEFDYVLKGKLKMQIGEYEEVLEPGDSIYYNSATPHGLIALDGEDCQILAVVIKE